MWCLWKEGIKHSGIHLWEYAVCGEKAPVHALSSTGYGASALARKPHRWLSISGITIPLKNGCVKPSRSSRVGGTDV